MSKIRIYQTIQKLEWSCPGALAWVDENGKIVASQQNPENGLTYYYPEDSDDWGDFDPSEYVYVREVSRPFPSTAQAQADLNEYRSQGLEMEATIPDSESFELDIQWNKK